MKNTNPFIITGQYRAADAVQQAMIQSLFGENAEYRYEVYFHWYNVIHELGHAIMMFNQPERPHPAQEEQLVNDFAVAYWRHYGEEDKLRELSGIVEDALSRLAAPSQDGHLEYAEKNWGTDAFITFESYGWFQFSCVQSALSGHMSLEQALARMSPFPVIHQESMTLPYAVNEGIAQSVVTEAIRILTSWGITLPQQIPVSFCDDVNCHMLAADHYDQIRRQLQAKLDQEENTCDEHL